MTALYAVPLTVAVNASLRVLSLPLRSVNVATCFLPSGGVNVSRLTCRVKPFGLVVSPSAAAAAVQSDSKAPHTLHGVPFMLYIYAILIVFW